VFTNTDSLLDIISTSISSGLSHVALSPMNGVWSRFIRVKPTNVKCGSDCANLKANCSICVDLQYGVWSTVRFFVLVF
jgi:hypothetical protein